jgi:glycosyltransferase involved in cell wall biosynthesis
MQVTYFFRKPFMDYHKSIEGLFSVILKNMPKSVEANQYEMKWKSKGFVKRLMNSVDVIGRQGSINHITGDIHYTAAFMKKGKTILTIHDLAPLHRGNRFKRALIRFFWFQMPAWRVEKVTVISEFVKEQLLEEISIPASKIEVVYDCVPGDLVPIPEPLHHSRPVILHIGTMPNKNLDNVVKALTGLDIELLILGKLSKDQTKLLEGSGIGYKAYYDLDYEDVKKLYGRSNIVLYASQYEGFGLPILEANAIGRPVITSNVTSMPEVAGDAAMLVDPMRPAEIRSAITTLIDDKELRAHLVAKGFENIKRFQPKTIALQYASLYQKIIEKS